MNYGYSPTFPAPAPHYFRLPQSRPPVASPYLLPPVPSPLHMIGVTNPALQPPTQQLQLQPPSAAAASTTTTTTTTTNSNNKSSDNLFPYSVTSVQPVTSADGKIPNKTFEVLEKMKPPQSFPLPIPTTVIALDSRSKPVFRLQTPSPSSDAIEEQTASKLSASLHGSSEFDGDHDALRLVSERQGLLVNEIKVYSDPPIVRWMFLVAGIILFVLGILTALWCRPSDQFYYCRIWAGIAVGFVYRWN